MLGESRSVIREPDGASARRQQENDEHRHDSCRKRDCDAGESLPELDEDEPRGGEPHDDAREGDGTKGHRSGHKATRAGRRRVDLLSGTFRARAISWPIEIALGRAILCRVDHVDVLEDGVLEAVRHAGEREQNIRACSEADDAGENSRRQIAEHRRWRPELYLGGRGAKLRVEVQGREGRRHRNLPVLERQ